MTFDGIQAHHLIPLHKILDLSGIDELIVSQPVSSFAIGDRIRPKCPEE